MKLSNQISLVDDFSIHENQIQVGNLVLDNYLANHHSVLIHSEMQAGKTGVAFYVASKAVNLLHLDQTFLICGMGDNSLKNQDIKRFQNARDVTICFNPDLQKLLRKKESCISKRDLVIYDESHYGSQKNQVVHQFLREIIGLDPSQNSLKWKNQSAYMLSISATPFTVKPSNHVFKTEKYVCHL